MSAATFKCEQHSSIILKQLQNFYKQNELYDTVLNFGRGANFVLINAHKIVLSALSEYFMEMFLNAQSKNLYEIKEIDASTIKPIIDFMYSGLIELSMTTVEGILRTSCFLKIQTLIDGCCEFIEKNITVDNAMAWVPLAIDLKLPKLGVSLFKFKNTKSQLKKQSEVEEFLMFNENELINYLHNENSHKNFEEYMFLSMVKWINYDRCNREHLLLQVLSMVDFKNLSPKFIVEHIDTVCKTVESYEFLCSWLKWHLSSEKKEDTTPNPKDSLDKLAALQISTTSEIQIQTYDPELNSWLIMEKNKVRLLDNKSSFSTIVIGHKLFVVGGKDSNNRPTNTVQCLDLDTFKWIEGIHPMGKNRCLCQLADLNGYLCVFGGFDIFDACDMCFETTVEIFNFSTNQWNENKPPKKPTKRNQIASHNGILYILDLYNGFLQFYDASTNQWTLKQIERDFFNEFDLAAVGGFLYVIGGSLEQTIKVFDLSTYSWQPGETTLKNIDACVKSTVFGNKIYISGEDSGKIVAVEEYDPVTKTLKTLSPLSKIGTFETVLIFVFPKLTK